MPHIRLGELLFVDPGVDFEMMLPGMAVLVLLLLDGKPSRLTQWLDEFSSCEDDTFVGFQKFSLKGPNFRHDSESETTIYGHIEVLFEKLSIQQAEDMVTAVGRDDKVLCFECNIGRLENDFRKVLFKVAAPSCPILGISMMLGKELYQLWHVLIPS